MTDPAGLLLVALLCAEVAAVGLAVRVRVGRPMLALLAFALMDEVAVQLLHVFVFASAPRPLAGWARAGWHLETLFVMGWPVALAACALSAAAPDASAMSSVASGAVRGLGGNLSGHHPVSVTAPPRRAPGPYHAAHLLAALYLGAVVGLALNYPPPRAVLRGIFLAWELLCVVVAWWGLWRGRRRTWGPVEVCLVVLVSCETMIATVGPFASDPFTRWWIGRAFYLGAWGAVVAVMARKRG